MLTLTLALAMATSAEPPPFVVESVRDPRVVGNVVRLGADGSARIDDADIPAGQFVALRRPGMPPSRPHHRPHVLLANGDRVPGRLLAIENDVARFSADFGQESGLSIPLTAVSAVWMTSRGASIGANRKQFDPDTPRKQDVVRLTNGDVIAGSVSGMPNDGLLGVQVGKEMSAVVRDRIEAIIFSTELARMPRPNGADYRLVTRNGARLSLSKVTIDGAFLAGVTVFGESLRLPFVELAALSISGGPVRYLSDLKPQRYESTPFLGLSWPLVNDRNVVRGDLRLGAGTFDKGLGLHSACRVIYPIPERTVRFSAWAGLDDATGRRGAAVLRLLADGQPVSQGAWDLVGGQMPHEIAVRVPPGAREWSIVIEYGSGGDVQDHVNLGDARFIVAP